MALKTGSLSRVFFSDYLQKFFEVQFPSFGAIAIQPADDLHHILRICGEPKRNQHIFQFVQAHLHFCPGKSIEIPLELHSLVF